MKGLVLACATLAAVNADVYLQNPRGSNNRLDDRGRDRNNANRLFDSQNNNRGGYNVGQLYYYDQSAIPIEWTNQHSCGGPNNNCELVMQYACDERIRDGTQTNTPPTAPIQCTNMDCDTDVRFGRHESWDSYMQCNARERNKGLFTGTQRINRQSAIGTRQNPNGARRGYECPEERDYYPYWHPTIWRDIAILTNQPQRCESYQAESQNVKSRFFCDLPASSLTSRRKYIPINQGDCEMVDYFDKTLNKTITGVWKEQKAWGVAPPVCADNWGSRDNHLGNVEGGHNSIWNWTLPSDWIHEQCVFRMRYNISTGDLDHFDSPQAVTSAALTAAEGGDQRTRSRVNKGRTEPAKVDMYTKYGIASRADADIRGYYLQNNPRVDMFGSLLKAATDSPTAPPVNPTAGGTTAPDNGGDAPSVGAAGPITLQLAINTAQYGRTFQDRSHRFAIRKRPAAMEGTTIHNLNVRGKRGNVVQTYPGTEYDFVPNRLLCKNGDYIHFQWTGSNTNPNNNAGQGKQGTDRHNAILLAGKKYEEAGMELNTVETFGQFGGSYPARVDEPEKSPFLGLAQVDRQALALLDTPGGQFGGELSELDDAGTYFDLGPRKCTKNGVYHYMCTRNNNFSNRSQKAKIVVADYSADSVNLGYTGGVIVSSGDKLEAPVGALTGPQTFVLTGYSAEHPTSFPAQEGEPSSQYVQVSVANGPGTFNLAAGKSLKLTVTFEDSLVGYQTLYHSDTLQGQWTEVEETEFDNDEATTQISKGGFYVVRTSPNIAAIVFVSIGCVALLLGVGFLFWKKFRTSDLSRMRGV